MGGEVREGLSGLLGIPDRLVVHVGEVADVFRRCATQFDHATENILHDEGAEVSNVRRTVHRGAAAVEAQGLPVQRGKGAFGA